MPPSSFRTCSSRPFCRFAVASFGYFVLTLYLFPILAGSLVAQELDPKVESRINAEIESLRELFVWFDTLKIFPAAPQKLIWMQKDVQSWPHDDWPKFAVVLRNTEAQLEFMRFDILRNKRDKREENLFGDKGSWYRDVDIETASYIWERYLENGVPLKIKTNERGQKELALSGFLLARFTDQNRQPQIADEVLRRIVETDLASLLTRQMLDPFFQLRVLQQISLDLCVIDVDRANVRDRLKQFLVVFPSSKHNSRAEKMLAIMTAMAAEDLAHAAAIEQNKTELTQQARIDELVFQLRNLAGRPIFSKSYAAPMNDPRGVANPASQLAMIGFPAVPSLIKAIDDERLSCCMTFRSAEEFCRPLTVGECAIFVLSEISAESFAQHLTPSPMFEKAPGLETAKHDVVEWWQKIQHMGEFAYLRDRIRAVDNWDAYRIAEILIEKYRSEAVPILAQHHQELEPEGWHSIVSLIAKDPRPEDVPFFESQRDCKSLSARVHAARALLKLGHNQVVNEQIAFWLHVVDSPELLEQITKMDSDPNGRIELVNFLAKCGRPDAIDALARGMPKVEPNYCHTIMDCVYRNFGQRKTNWTEEVAQQPKPVRDACIRLYLSALVDVRVQPERNVPGVIDFETENETENETPKFNKERVCDQAASYLTNLSSGEPRYDFQLPTKERDERIESIRKLHTIP